jgi:hypothetical protein
MRHFTLFGSYFLVNHKIALEVGQRFLMYVRFNPISYGLIQGACIQLKWILQDSVAWLLGAIYAAGTVPLRFLGGRLEWCSSCSLMIITPCSQRHFTN